MYPCLISPDSPLLLQPSLVLHVQAFYDGGGSGGEAYDPSNTAISMPSTGMKQIGVDLMYEVEGKGDAVGRGIRNERCSNKPGGRGSIYRYDHRLRNTDSFNNQSAVGMGIMRLYL